MIRTSGLNFTYPGAATPTLDNLSFEIGAGEVYGLLGPSGAGKSTTQRILMGLLGGFSGEATLFGQPVQSLGRALYERIGVSFELPTVYLRLTALENLRLFSALYEKPTRDPMEVLAEVDLADAANQRAEQFSKGMKMRLNLARSHFVVLLNMALFMCPREKTIERPLDEMNTSGVVPARL
jgi:fluoroquinolone transport system ATP-binding protein